MLARPETFDQIIVEASGVARPDAMAAAASMLPGVFLSAVVIVADARSVRARASDRYVGDLITAQLQAGDYVLLNKIDQISPDQLRREEAWLRQICPQTPLIAATGAEIDPNLILDPLPGASARGGSIAREGAPADEAFVSFTFSLPNSVDADRLGARLARPDKGLLRAKGFVLDAARGAQVLQVVGRRWSVSAPAIGARPVARVVTCIALRARLDLAYLSSLRAQFEL
jgi:G3E family GTPase